MSGLEQFGVMARRLALEAGFTEAAVVSLPYKDERAQAERLGEFAEAGREGQMDWLVRRDASGELLRGSVARPFAWAKSALLCLASYKSGDLRSVDVHDAGQAWIARYAVTGRVEKAADGEERIVPSDYHRVLKKRLVSVEACLKKEFGEFESRAFVDTGPVMERALAVAAGLGWTGKNTCLIHPQKGSWNFLCVLLMARESDVATVEQADRCGSCRRCIEACPTGALIEPYKMDARRCISYLTIEHKGAIEEELMEQMGRQVFGCDICQDVCPWNRKVAVSADDGLRERGELVNPTLEWLAGMDEAEYERVFNGSPVRRSGYEGFKRNMSIAIGNSGRLDLAEKIRPWLAETTNGLKEAVPWAIKKLESIRMFEK